ncbi:ParB N-terminal domain-containing protein, partial [Bradyrhizobium iriomotense]|uniref:ParB N-terminal domain-containing protein n=1 Tax=Bradyrhizobium iriomotense TaxID=441950 RepID=UPI0024E0A33C
MTTPDQKPPERPARGSVTTKSAPRPRRNVATNVGLIEIEIHYRAVVDLILDSRNPRQHSQVQVNLIADSIREFGFVMPIVVDDTRQVVIGHGRVLA